MNFDFLARGQGLCARAQIGEAHGLPLTPLDRLGPAGGGARAPLAALGVVCAFAVAGAVHDLPRWSCFGFFVPEATWPATSCCSCWPSPFIPDAERRHRLQGISR